MTPVDPSRGPAAALPEDGGPIAAPALRGSIWTLGGYATSQVLRLASNLILTRLLFPEVFGQMALVFLFLQGLTMFSDVGTGPAIVQGTRGNDPRFLNTAWTIQCMRGVSLWLASWAIALPVASFYGQPLLARLIPAAGLSAVMAGFEATAMHTLQRQLRLGRLTLVELAGQVAGMVATISGALIDRMLFGPNHPSAAWAIVAGGLANSAVRLVASHTVLPGIRHHFFWERDAARHLFGFGRWIFVSTALTFLAAQSDRLMFGKMIPLDLFGVYGIAAMLAALPTEAVLKLGGWVVFPAYSRLVERGDFGQVFGRVRLPLLLGGASLVTALIGTGPFLVALLYDPRYLQAGAILQYLAVAAWFQILECTNGAALLALGRVRWVAAGSGAKVLGMVALLPLGYRLGGFRGALAGLVLSEVLKYLTSATGAAVAGLKGLRRDVLITAVVAVTAAAAFLAGGALRARPGGNLAGFFGAAAIALAVWGAIGLRYLWRPDARGALRQLLERPARP